MPSDLVIFMQYGSPTGAHTAKMSPSKHFLLNYRELYYAAALFRTIFLNRLYDASTDLPLFPNKQFAVKVHTSTTFCAKFYTLVYTCTLQPSSLTLMSVLCVQEVTLINAFFRSEAHMQVQSFYHQKWQLVPSEKSRYFNCLSRSKCIGLK